uniref:Uncharacterized protein n=1 Tax=Arundo donax TaxID=35708 RepID=A0A0A8ZSW4_ARUDO
MRWSGFCARLQVLFQSGNAFGTGNTRDLINGFCILINTISFYKLFRCFSIYHS